MNYTISEIEKILSGYRCDKAESVQDLGRARVGAQNRQLIRTIEVQLEALDKLIREFEGYIAVMTVMLS